ncbi:hypothetical protein BCR32DRAFT_249736 [Anaeromyces robustus]|uniref:Uncharacterized protein n=1 Tax=Anaeromyces robustus TaxID=1754192 RepID=A0A1Y1WPK0_9FUNG|nr:hypothetical protein BCR32DRAFT_249736 [Anaeromyces robustus]|eukprot:ORX75186.1 hypothetical protein BCR32DRAFT_249736 [Anaeromyces robustus]
MTVIKPVILIAKFIYLVMGYLNYVVKDVLKLLRYLFLLLIIISAIPVPKTLTPIFKSPMFLRFFSWIRNYTTFLLVLFVSNNTIIIIIGNSITELRLKYTSFCLFINKSSISSKSKIFSSS